MFAFFFSLFCLEETSAKKKQPQFISAMLYLPINCSVVIIISTLIDEKLCFGGLLLFSLIFF